MAGVEHCYRRWLEAGNSEIPPSDVHIVTSDRRRIAAHSTVLAYSSSVLESLLMDQPTKGENSHKVIRIVGVPYEAVQAFIRFLYSGNRCFTYNEKETQHEMKKYSMHLLVLSHAYRVGWLKKACERTMITLLGPNNVVDVLVLAHRCDAPSLYLRCIRLLSRKYNIVKETEAWKFLQDNDPSLELEILESLQDDHLREKRRRRKNKEVKLYNELNDAMECLRHICMEGCTHVGPSGRRNHGRRPNPAGCPNQTTCYGLQQLLRHFYKCNHNCSRCNRLWELLKVHASICDSEDNCQVPLCRQFKKKMEQKGSVDEKWMLLVQKVRSAGVMSYLARRKRKDEVIEEACSNLDRL